MAMISDRRAWVLLDTESHLGYRKNETTAAAWTSTGHAVEVSVVLADPPAISRCFVHCDGLTAEQFTMEPRVIRAAGAFLLLRMAISPSSDVKPVNDIFVYKSGPGKPSLYLLPHPYPQPFYSTRIAVLPVGVDCEQFSLVAPVSRFKPDSVAYDLHIFASDSKSWSTKRIAVSEDEETCYDKLAYHQTSKVISLGGGAFGWVDLWHGIAICDVLADEPVMRLMQFPEPHDSNRLECGRQFNLPSARPIRDVTYSDGVLRFVEIEHRQNSSIEGGYGDWTATIWCREVSSEDWTSCLKVDSSDICATTSCLPCLLPEMCDIETNKLDLSRVISTCPTLGLYDDGVMYMMSKLNPEDPRTFVIAINTKSKTLEGIAKVSSERVYTHPTYLPCSFSNYIIPIPETETANRLNLTCEKVVFQGTLRAVYDLLSDIAIDIVEFQGTTRNKIMSITYSGTVHPCDFPEMMSDEYLGFPEDLVLHSLTLIDSAKNLLRNQM